MEFKIRNNEQAGFVFSIICGFGTFLLDILFDIIKELNEYPSSVIWIVSVFTVFWWIGIFVFLNLWINVNKHGNKF